MYAQYTGVINSNNPSFSESPYSVGTGVYQFESNLFYRYTTTDFILHTPHSYGINLQFRNSLFSEKSEFQVTIAAQQDRVTYQNSFTLVDEVTGIGHLSLGIKHLVYEQEYKDKSKEIRSWKKRHAFDWLRLIPSVAIFGGYNTNAVSRANKRESGTFKAGVLLQNNIRKDLNIITNAYYDYIGSENPEINFIITGTYSLSDRWSTFLEYQNIFREFVNEISFGTGLAYLYSRNLQINSSFRYSTQVSNKGIYTSLGISYRIDRHQDSFTEIKYDAFGNSIITNDNTTKLIQNEKKLSKPASNRNRATKSIKRSINKKQIRKKVRREKKEKKKKRKEKKEAKKLDNMSVEDIEKELKKLEREEKRLERQQKKEEERRKRAAAKKKKKKDKDDNNTEN